MDLFIGTLLVFLCAALAMGLGLLIKGKPMHGGCRSLPADRHCRFEMLCGGACRRKAK
ncbi:MAG: hypothetical protein ACR2QV_04355 [Gammaproteobacteria bacterium]